MALIFYFKPPGGKLVVQIRNEHRQTTVQFSSRVFKKFFHLKYFKNFNRHSVLNSFETRLKRVVLGYWKSCGEAKVYEEVG